MVLSKEGNLRQLLSVNRSQVTALDFETILKGTSYTENQLYDQAHWDMEPFNRTLKEGLQTASQKENLGIASPQTSYRLRDYMSCRHRNCLLNYSMEKSFIQIAELCMPNFRISARLDIRQTFQKAKIQGIQTNNVEDTQNLEYLSSHCFSRLLGKDPFTCQLLDGQIWTVICLAPIHEGWNRNATDHFSVTNYFTWPLLIQDMHQKA